MCFLRDVIGSLDCNLVFWLARIKPFPPFLRGEVGKWGHNYYVMWEERGDHMGHSLHQQINQPKLYTVNAFYESCDLYNRAQLKTCVYWITLPELQNAIQLLLLPSNYEC